MVMYYILTDGDALPEDKGCFVLVRSDKYVSYHKRFPDRYSIMGTFFHENLESNVYNLNGMEELLDELEKEDPNQRNEFDKIREAMKNVREQGRGREPQGHGEVTVQER